MTLSPEDRVASQELPLAAEDFSTPLVSIVIPHIGTRSILVECLESLLKTTYLNHEIIVVDNGSDLNAADILAYGNRFRYHKTAQNLGYAGGCNAGITLSRGDYVIFLNNDTQVDPAWIEPLVRLMEANPELAACQPRLLSLRHAGKLDYAGGMGGLMDMFGYPFALGRVFDALEDEADAYVGTYPIFWASGTAAIWRKSVLAEVGPFDEDFFAHMEEIDLCWRAQLVGYELCSTADSRVFHHSGFSLSHHNWRKMYLNHRNNLIMLLKNYQLRTLAWIYPVRLLMEFLVWTSSILTLNWRRALAIMSAQVYVILHLARIVRKRRAVQDQRTRPDRMLMNRIYRGSLIWQYVVRRHRRASEFVEVRARG